MHEIESKWQKAWAEHKAFEPNTEPGKQKFLCTFPYPYVNGLPHVGHMFSIMRTESFARYKRARGYNVLFPQAWHCTGSPIVNAAKRVAEGDEKQISILKEFGVPQEEVKDFTKAEHWIAYFAPRYKADLQSLGMSIDWRREFITTSLNPHYDRFIRWQFNRLKEKGYVAIGKHPVVWCPKEHVPVSDHSRLSGEGETPQEFTLILFDLDGTDEQIAVATLRPETISGVTNIWVNPNIEYVKANVDSKTWIVSKECAEKLKEQEHTVEILSTIKGKELIGKHATGPGTKSVPLLPASFPTANKGSGIVMSVPSDAPDDYVALRDVQQDKKTIDEYKLHGVEKIKPIPVIDAGELGHEAAVKVVHDMKILHQNERDKLEAAKKLVYKKGYYEGKMLSGLFKGEKVEVAKEAIKQKLVADRAAILFYELTGPVVCRCVTPSIVKIVSNQWFIKYGDAGWKKLAHKALDEMKLYPEKSRQQFDYVIDWLNDWACTREEGMGTRLPWDEHWLIESLSDSTFYNAYYTISHHMKNMPSHELTDEFFTYVFQGKGAAKNNLWKECREDFLYWYPVDFRNSGKDLIQNHLAFMLFNHVALLEDSSLWPKGYGVNGWVTVDGKKMSKSLGNLIPVRAMVPLYGADACRLTILNGGEGMDDPNWDSELAKATKQRLEAFLELVKTHYNKGRTTRQPLDEWFESKLHSTIKKTTDAMELTNFRTAIQHAWFELSNIIKEYLKLTEPNKQLIAEALRAQLLMLQPFAPHTSEEAWQLIGEKGFASHAAWPSYDEEKIRPAVEQSHDLLEQLASDIRNVQQLLRLERVQEVRVIVSASWKYGFTATLKAHLQETRNPGEIIRTLLPLYKEHAQEIPKLVPGLVKDPGKLPSAELTQEAELAAVHGATEYLAKAFGAVVHVEAAEKSSEKKAGAAFPGRPAIILK